MTLPIRLILWAGNDADHNDHLHVEGLPKMTGTPPLTNPGKTPSVQSIYDAMTVTYGTGYYFADPIPPKPNWSHMGWYNRRPIAGTTVWSQHAYSNAIDIGPLYGVKEQRPYYDFLTMEAKMGWDNPGDPILNMADCIAVNKWQGETVMREQDIRALWPTEKANILWQSRQLDLLMLMDLRKADRG